MTDILAPRTDFKAFVSHDVLSGGDRIEVLVRGARCGGCMSKIEKAVTALPGVESARLNLTTGKLVASCAAGRADPARLVACVEALGYGASLFDPARALEAEDREGKELALALGVAGFGVGNVMMFTVPVWAGLFGQELDATTRQVLYWMAAIIATPCALFAGKVFFRSAWSSLRRGKANMDVPISIGVLLTLGVSFSETLLGGPHAYFDAAVTLIFLLLIGRYLDHKLRAKARSAARDLLALQSPIALRLAADGSAAAVPVAEVSPGDRLRIAPGERVPVDGVIEAGETEIDNAMITGESLPVRAGPGVKIHAGALNLSGLLTLRATAHSEDSAIAAIARLMEAGAQTKSAYVRLADKAAALYVPIVHTLALVTFAGGWALGLGPREALLRAAAVLIVTCPCALGLAVPAVQVTASGRLFRRGVLVKSGAALERMAEVDHIVFDKTGVLTSGKPQLIAPIPAELETASRLARASRHPLARALADAGPCLADIATDVIETPGLGVAGRIDGRAAKLGRAAFLGVTGSGLETELWFAFDGETPVRFAFSDQPRPDAAKTVAALKAKGYGIEILSGDTAGAAQAIADQVGIQNVCAGLTPADKAAAIQALTARGKKVLMVGDGLNDAAALALAHASMAPGSAIDASQNAADLVFSGDDLAAVPLALDVAKKARARALENFAFSALYNVIASPAAMLGLINPFIAALAMSGSSLAVTLNALRMGLAGRGK